MMESVEAPRFHHSSLVSMKGFPPGGPGILNALISGNCRGTTLLGTSFHHVPLLFFVFLLKRVHDVEGNCPQQTEDSRFEKKKYRRYISKISKDSFTSKNKLTVPKN